MTYQRTYFSLEVSEDTEFNHSMLAGDIAYPIEYDKFYFGGKWNIAGYVNAMNPVQPNAISETIYKTHVLLPKIKQEYITEIKLKQQELYLEIEGPDNINLLKAFNRAYVSAEFTDYDTIMFKKSTLRSDANLIESMINAIQNYDDIFNFTYTLEIATHPVIEFTAITVGSFMARFTPDEKASINEHMIDNKALEKDYSAMLNRTHINLSDAGLGMILQLLEQEELLEELPLDSNYATRREEIIRAGTGADAWRPSMG